MIFPRRPVAVEDLFRRSITDFFTVLQCASSFEPFVDFFLERELRSVMLLLLLPLDELFRQFWLVVEIGKLLNSPLGTMLASLCGRPFFLRMRLATLDNTGASWVGGLDCETGGGGS